MKLVRVYQAGFAQAPGAVFSLEAEASHHLGVVLKIGAGERFVVCDGKGSDYLSEVTFSGDRKRSMEARVVQVLPPSGMLTQGLDLGVALCKGERFERLLEKAAELGVSLFYPVLTTRSLGKERGQRLDRWQRIAREASALAGRSYEMQVFEPVSLEEILTSQSGLLFHQGGPAYKADFGASRNSRCLLIGPEGGFTDAEVEKAQRSHSWRVVGLGSRNLRVETAAVVAMTLILMENGEFEVVDDDTSKS